MDWMRTKVENIKYCICVVLLILLDSCVNREITIMTEDKIAYPQVENADLSEVLYADKLIVSDSFLVVINRKAEPFFYIYDADSFLFKEKFGFSGNGPEDFLFPFFMNQTDSVSEHVSVYDVNLASFKDINIKRLLAHEEKAIVSSSMPSALIGASVLVENNHLYYGNIDSGEGLFFVYDSILNVCNWISFPSSLLPSEGDFTVMNSNRIAVNTRLNRVVSGMRFYNKLYLYDVEKKEMLKEVMIGRNPIFPILEGQSINGESQLCCMETHATDQYVYVLMQRVREKDWDNADGEPSRIIVLDWELNYVKTYQLAHHTNSFAIDVRNNRILYTAANDEGHTILYYWKETFDDVK